MLCPQQRKHATEPFPWIHLSRLKHASVDDELVLVEYAHAPVVQVSVNLEALILLVLVLDTPVVVSGCKRVIVHSSQVGLTWERTIMEALVVLVLVLDTVLVIDAVLDTARS